MSLYVPAAKRTRYSAPFSRNAGTTYRTYRSRARPGTYRRKYGFYRPLSQVGNRPGSAYSTGFPKMLKMSHRYVTNHDFVEGGGTYWYWTCNGMYGPEGSFVGHQPLYFDQLTALYDHYTVIGSRIKLTITTTADYPLVGSLIIDDAPVARTYNDINERPSATNFTLSPANGGSNQTVITKSWSAKQAFGSAAISDPNLQGNASSNPAEMQYYTLAFTTPTADNYRFTVIAEVEYIAVWQELKVIARS